MEDEKAVIGAVVKEEDICQDCGGAIRIILINGNEEFMCNC